MLRRQAAALIGRNRRPLSDAQQHVMGFVKAGIGEIDIVGGNQRHIMAISQIQQPRFDPVFHRQAVALQLDIQPVAENRLQPQQHGLGRSGLTIGQQPPQRAGRAAGQADQPGIVLFQQVDRKLRHLMAFGLHEGMGQQSQQRIVTGLVLAQQHDLIRRRGQTALGGRRFRYRRLLRRQCFRADAAQIGLCTHDRLHPGLHRRLGEFDRAEQIAAIGHRKGGHPLLGRQLDQILDLQRPFRQRIGRMNPQMNEIGVGDSGVGHGADPFPLGGQNRTQTRIAIGTDRQTRA